MGVKENPIRLISNEKIALILISFSKKIKGSTITVIRRRLSTFEEVSTLYLEAVRLAIL